MIEMLKAVHLGPTETAGGMSEVIKNLVGNSPIGWDSTSIPTHDESPLGMVSTWAKSLKDLRKKIIMKEVDLAHIHVTHSMSWHRKRSFMKLCEFYGVPVVLHIHSGKFDRFCKGIFGNSVKKEFGKPNRAVIVLEDRWIRKLDKWLPKNTSVVRNHSIPVTGRENFSRSGKIKLLLLSRNSRVKGQMFAIEVLRFLKSKKVPASLTITGFPKKRESVALNSEGDLDLLGWVSEKRKRELIASSDFLLSPSEYEGSSMSVIESIVSGLPCIVSEASRETICNNDLVVSEFSTKLWANKILQFSEKGEYEEIVEKLKESSSIYGPEENRRQIKAVYERLLSSKQR